jgi:hypothetical protein
MDFALDLSDFNHESHNFEEFVTELHEFHETDLGQKWEFEKTLLYLVLPDLCRLRKADSRKILVKFCKWLMDVKDVQKIIELVVPDNHQYPLDEEFVERELIRKFEVEILDWRKLDIDLRPIIQSEGKAQSLRKLKLYSSGNWGSLYQWASADRKVEDDNIDGGLEHAYGLTQLEHVS